VLSCQLERGTLASGHVDEEHHVAVTKTERKAGRFSPECYAYVRNVKDSATWRGRLFASPSDEVPDAELVGAALSLLAELRDNLPAADFRIVRNRVTCAWQTLHPEGRLPAVLQ
jgi:hypothetical protein